MSNLDKLIKFCEKANPCWIIQIDTTYRRDEEGEYIKAIQIRCSGDTILGAHGEDSRESIEALAGRLFQHLKDAFKAAS